MWNFIITAVLNFVYKLWKADNTEKLESENSALKGRSESVSESYEEQENARKAAEKAKEDVEKQGSMDDVFGSEEWNEKWFQKEILLTYL